MRIALVYDRVNKFGGAERVLQALHEIWPEAPLYTAVYNPETAPWARDFKVIPSFLQKFPWAKTKHELYPWLTPLAFESLNFDEYDVVISITSEAAKGIITKPKTLHLCYCLTPTRYLWSGAKDYKIPFWGQMIVSKLRAWDLVAAQRPDVYWAISQNVAQRIKKYYGRESEVIYPPIDVSKWCMVNGEWKRGNYYLLVSRLVPYKKVEIVIEAFNKLGWPLKIVGVGSELGRLKRWARKNIEFLGQLTDEELLRYYQNCLVVVFPQEEDFGLVPLEAQACGKPVIAFKEGGAQETVLEGKTGEFFYPQTAEALIDKIKTFKVEKYHPEDCRRQAQKFDLLVFKKQFTELVKQECKTYSKSTYMS